MLYDASAVINPLYPVFDGYPCAVVVVAAAALLSDDAMPVVGPTINVVSYEDAVLKNYECDVDPLTTEHMPVVSVAVM